MGFRKFWFVVLAGLLVAGAGGCARIWNPIFWAGKGANQKYYDRPVYYPGRHPECTYEGPHVHDPKQGYNPAGVTDTDPKIIRKKYRYPGMEDSWKEADERW